MADVLSLHLHPSRQAGHKAYAFAALGCIALLLFAWHKMGSDLLTAWQSDEYSHGIIIPFIALLIAWHRLVETCPPVRPSWLGVSMLAISGGLLLVAVLAAFPTAAHYGFILALAGVALTFVGAKATITMLPAFVYLAFAIPLPHLMLANLSENLQLISSTLGVKLLELLGIPVFQEGNVIDLGQYKLQVIEACSGLRYLFPLISFSYLAAYLLQDRLWKRAVVFLSAIPITIGMNALRIALIGTTVNLWGQHMAEGVLHEFEGWVIFLLCILFLMAEVRGLLRIGTHGHFNFEVFGAAHGPLFSGLFRPTAPVITAFALSALLAGIFGTGLIDERSEVIPTHPPLATFPLLLNGWHGRQHSLEPDILQSLQLSDYWLADYAQDNDKAPINFYIAYYDNQRIGSSTHSPSNCIPGGGWQIAGRTIKTLVLAGGETLNVTRLLIRKGPLSQLVYYWFDERGRNITETTYAKWYLLVDAIHMHRTDGALVRLVTQIATGESEEEAEKRLMGFLFAAYHVMKNFIPGQTLLSPPSSAKKIQ